MTRVKRNTHVEPPPLFFDDTSWAHCETLLSDSTDVREANCWHKWVANSNFHQFFHISSSRAHSPASLRITPVTHPFTSIMQQTLMIA